MSHPAPAPEECDAQWRDAFLRRLKRWYLRKRRSLPWRATQDPYAVWVSEIMLQQTQVATVIPYFERFLQRFPTVETLARAEIEEVLRLWEGLGLLRRARSMHQAAQTILLEHDGHFPTRYEQVLALPGIGRYTAGAILSIALDQRLPILEANTQRLYARLIRLEDDPKTAVSQKTLWRFAQWVLPERSGSGVVNQAMMELGALVCAPKQPDCGACPVASLCLAHRQGLQERIPPAKSPQTYEPVDDVAVVVIDGDRVLMRRCGDGETWAGLWDFPRIRLDRVTDDVSTAERVHIEREVQRRTGVPIELAEQVLVLRHAVTRYRIRLRCYRAEVSGRLRRAAEDAAWFPLHELASLPLNTTGRTIVRRVVD